MTNKQIRAYTYQILTALSSWHKRFNHAFGKVTLKNIFLNSHGVVVLCDPYLYHPSFTSKGEPVTGWSLPEEIIMNEDFVGLAHVIY